MIVVPFLALALSLSPFSEDNAEPEQAPNVVVTYDLSTIEFDQEDTDPDLYARSLVPYTRLSTRERGVLADHAVSEERGSADFVAELVRDLFAEEFNYEGRALDVTADGRFLVRGPAALHNRIAAVLAFLEDNANAENALLVDVFGFDGGTDLEGPAVRQDADGLVARLGASANSHRSYRLHLHVDRTSVLDLSRKVDVLFDYDVEIAQASAIADPIVSVASIGTWLAVRGAPNAGGLDLALTIKRGEQLASDSIRDLDMRSQISSEGKATAWIDSASEITPLAVLNRSMALNTHIGAGKALVLKARVSLERGQANELIVLRNGGGTLAELRKLELDETGRALFVADLGTVAPPLSTARGWLLQPGHVDGTLGHAGRSGDASLLRAGVTAGYSDPRVEMMQDMSRGMELNPVGRYLIAYFNPDVFDTQSEGLAKECQDRFTAAFEAFRATGETLDLTVELTRGGSESAAFARVPVRAGESCAIALGVEDLVVRDYDVEVAQFAATVDPFSQIRFDGLVIWLRPSFGTSGNLTLDVRGGGQLLTDSDLFGDRNPMFGGLDLSRFAQLFVKERLVMEPVEGGYAVSLGDLVGTSGPEALRLDVRIARGQ